MRLHYYAPPVQQSYCVGIHNGHGFGSLFAKIFSKVAAKTAARTAVSVAKSAGKKALRIAAKKGAEFAKKAAKEGLKQAAEIGTELATQKINSLAESAVKKNVPPVVVHSIRDVATRGVGTAGHTVKTLGTDKLHGLIDKGSSKAVNLGDRLIDKGVKTIGSHIGDHHSGPSKPTKTTSATATAKRKRKKKKHHKPGASKKLRLANIIDEA